MKTHNTSPRISTAVLASLRQWNQREQPTLHPISPQIQPLSWNKTRLGGSTSYLLDILVTGNISNKHGSYLKPKLNGSVSADGGQLVLLRKPG
jgi:hypothetical protein